MEVDIRISKQGQPRSSVFNTPVIAIQFPLLTAGHFDATEIVGRTIMYSTGFQFLAISLWARVPNSRRAAFQNIPLLVPAWSSWPNHCLFDQLSAHRCTPTSMESIDKVQWNQCILFICPDNLALDSGFGNVRFGIYLGRSRFQTIRNDTTCKEDCLVKGASRVG